jgi:uncharacterized protein (DUF58 family)
VKRTATPKLGAYAGLAALGLIAALVFGLPELVALAAPFALVTGAGLVLAERPEIGVSFDLARERILEGDEVGATIGITSRGAVEQLDVHLELPNRLTVADGHNPVALHFSKKGEEEIELRLRCSRWGSYAIGSITLRAHDRFRFFCYDQRLDLRRPLKAYPRPEPIRELLRPLETQVFTGNLVAREKGEGIEFADLRPFVPGDRVRRVNWRASARMGELWVNELHAERNADVILFLDSFIEARREDESTLDRTVRAAAALVDRYLREKDRVGLVSFGGVLNWLLPATGLTQLYRIVDSLLDTEIVLNYAWKDIEIIPRRTLPPKALIVALSPLLDERAAHALLDLRGRGFDLALIEVSPVPFAQLARDASGEIAERIWRLKREALRGRYERSGVPVAVWNDEVTLAVALEEVRTFRRRAGRPVAVS